jgi:beta-lactam-binding protein with PASTA domain
VTGSVPFAADTTIATLMGRVDREMPVGDELGPLAPVLRQAGRPNAVDRPAADQLARDLASAGAGLAPASPLPLGGALEVERFEEPRDLTELPGRPVLFDGEQEMGQAPPTWQAMTPAPSLPPRPAPGRTPAGPAPHQPMATDAAEEPRKRHRWRWAALVVVVLVIAAGVGAVAYTKLRKPLHPVPSLAGKSTTDAGAVLASLHLHLRVRGQVFDERIGKGLISTQEPVASKRSREGSTISVDLSAGPPPVAVPELATLTADQAKQRLIGAGFTVGTVVNRSDNTVLAGVVISWSGEGGQVPKGSPIDLVVSTGKPKVAVPDLHGETFAQAQAALAALGLSAVEDDQFNDVAAGQVVGTTPASAAVADVGSVVTVTVSKGPDLVTVPSVVNLGVQTATASLEARGLSVVAVVGSPDRPVTMTSPAAGARVKRGSTVRLYTS